MEHRWHPRKRIDIEVALRVPDLGVIRARARDIGYGGMCLETRPWALRLNTKVRVNFRISDGTTVASVPIESLVVSVDGYRCGLMFADLDHDTVTFLQTFLQADVPSAPLRREPVTSRA